jgi:hypothetical protein
MELTINFVKWIIAGTPAVGQFGNQPPRRNKWNEKRSGEYARL